MNVALPHAQHIRQQSGHGTCVITTAQLQTLQKSASARICNKLAGTHLLTKHVRCRKKGRVALTSVIPGQGQSKAMYGILIAQLQTLQSASCQQKMVTAAAGTVIVPSDQAFLADKDRHRQKGSNVWLSQASPETGQEDVQI